MTRSVQGEQADGGPYARLKELGIVLMTPRTPVANYVTAVQEGALVYLSGQGPVEANGIRHTGKVGAGVTEEDAYGHARITAVNLMAVMHTFLGSLERVRRIVKVLGMVNAAPTFTNHPRVINGCSDILVSVFGDEIGRHARSAIGVGSLPGQITVEIEMIVAVHTHQPGRFASP
jgi:enamine deaminase RidA (YjgF/YER057c/UK114 family)